MTPLSPCSAAVKARFPEKATAWDIARGLLVRHPEYSHGMIANYLDGIDAAFVGEKRVTDDWFEDLSLLYPEAPLLHGRLVVVGLVQLDKDLARLLPEDIVSTMINDIV